MMRKERYICLLLILCLLLPFTAAAAEEPQTIRTDFTYFYLTVQIEDQTNGEIYTKSISGDTIEGGENTPEALEIRRDLIQQADEYANSLLHPGTELADRATSADLKWSYTNSYTVENENGGRTKHEDVYSSYHIIYSADIVADGTVWIDSVNISADAHGMAAGIEIDPEYNYPTAASLDEPALYSFERYAWTTGTGLDEAPFSGRVRADTDYYAMIRLRAQDRAKFSEELTILANGKNPTVIYRIDDQTVVIFLKYHVNDSEVDDPGQWDDTHLNPFLDVAEGAYYYDPVLWALDRGITTGTSDTAFSPSADCTRAQVVAFLWRAAGEPAPDSDEIAFTDVAPGRYYSPAVAWAVEQGITNGTSPTAFSPDSTCSRAEIVTFLWRASGAPGVGNQANPFTDVSAGRFYTDAVLWAVEKGVTKGTGPAAFSPMKTCSRAEVVTFLYRNMK